MSRVRILIVDDHDVIREALRSVLSSRPGWSVCGEAAHGRDALERARELSPDVVVMDVAMPVMDGLEALEALQKTCPDVLVVMLTMHESEELTSQMLQRGARGYVSKSSPISCLFDAVESVLRNEIYFSAEASEILLQGYLERHGDVAPKRTSARTGQLLTNDELEVVRRLARGGSNRDVAHALGVSVKTAESYRSAAMRKAGARSLGELVRYAIRNRIVEP